MSTSPKTVFITGGNTGLGYEVVKALAASSIPYTIIIGCRTPSKGEEAISTLKSDVSSTASTFSVVQIDVESDSSIEAAVTTLTKEHGQVDVLINNAGANLDFSLREKTGGDAATLRKVWNQTWDVNITGTHILTTLLVPLLLKSQDPRLIFLTSGTASIAETEKFDGPIYQRLNGAPDKGWPKQQKGMGIPVPASYRCAKSGLNMMMREWERILREDGVKVWAVSPGFLATGLGGVGADQLKQMGAKDPSEGGKFLRDVVEGKRDEDSGKSIRFDGVQPW